MGRVTKSLSACFLLPYNPKPLLWNNYFLTLSSVPPCLGPLLDSFRESSFPFISKSGTWARKTPGLGPAGMQWAGAPPHSLCPYSGLLHREWTEVGSCVALSAGVASA